MNVNTLPVLTLGGFLRDRRARLLPDPGAPGRRRTPGLRREEVAARAGVSVTWYTWLEQGRGGPPSDEVLERLARGLEMDAADREVLFLLARRRPPPRRPAPPPAVPPAVRRVLDAMPATPAIVKTPAWDVVAWNDAMAATMTDYGRLPAGSRNVLRHLFGDPGARARLPDWEDNARFALAVLRLDLARTGSREAAALAEELSAASADFRRLWAANEVRGHGAGLKRVVHPAAGLLVLEYSAFAVDGADGLGMIVFTPASDADRQAVAGLVAARAGRG